MKQIYIKRHFPPGKYRKALLIMNLKILMLFCLAGNLSAASLYSQSSTYELKVENKAIVSVLEDLRVRTGFQFFYQKGLIPADQNVSVSLENASLEDILDAVLLRNGYSYEIQDQVVLLSRAARPAANAGPSRAAQQDNRVTGRVADSSGSPLVGAAVVLEGSHIGVVTDQNGTFSISVPVSSGNLIFSFVGYERRTVPFVAGQNIEIFLTATNVAMEDVVITGYTTIDKRLSASAVTTLNMDDVKIPGVNTLDKMLQGQVPGLMVMNLSGSPNATPRIRMRGSSTIHGNAAPIWVIDGIIWEDPVNIPNNELNNILDGSTYEQLDGINENSRLSLLGNAISGLNPNDIDKITFLKDASATAIYGTRAANGVIVVTTKRGEIGDPTVSFNSSFGFTARPRYSQYNLMNSKERIELSREVIAGHYIYDAMPYRVGYEGALLDLYDNLITQDEFNRRVADMETRNTDWFDLLFRNSFTQDYTVSVSGGTMKNRYYVSASYGDYKGSAKGDSNTTYGMNMNMSTKFGKAVDVDWRLNYANRKSEGFYMVNPNDYALTTSRAIDPDEYYTTHTNTVASLPKGTFPLTYNIFNELANTGNTVNSRTVNASVALTARLTKDLQFQGTFGTSYANTQNRKWAGERSYYIATIREYDYGAALPGSDLEAVSRLPHGGILHYDNTNQQTYTARAQMNYNKSFKMDHVMSLSAGFEARSLKYEGFKTEEWGYYPDRGENISYEYDTPTSGSAHIWNNSSLSKHKVQNTNTLSNAISVYATAVYAYKNRYILNANVRTDASNRFGQYTNNRFQPIWSIAGRWSMAEENWLKNSTTVNDLSFRMSLGIQGNVPTSVGPNLIVQYPTTVFNRWTGEYVLNVSRWPYPDLRWEKTKSWNWGLDFSLFNNRIYGTVDYYLKKGRDIIFSLEVPAEYGVNSIMRNGANIKNTGIELSLGFSPVQTKDFKWTVTMIYSKNSNNVEKTDASKTYNYHEYLTGNAFREGKPVNAIYAWKYTGIDPEKGTATFENAVPLGEEIEKSSDPTTYLVYVGQKDPKFNGGINMAFTYKQWSLHGQFSFALGHYKRLNFLYDNEFRTPQAHYNMSSDLNNRWRQPGDENKPGVVPGLVYDSSLRSHQLSTPYADLSSYSMYNYSTQRIVKGDFFRCRNLTLSYYFTPEQLRPIRLKGLTWSFSVTNPFTICNSKFNGQDPEIENTGGTALPITKSFTMSLNFTF